MDKQSVVRWLRMDRDGHEVEFVPRQHTPYVPHM